ncbi:MAG: hypothetical protein K0R17_2147 [Rariglobus sp.]|jgi:hypothetical protein|nr:hypothetical protein [Rariglobus sp.]
MKTRTLLVLALAIVPAALFAQQKHDTSTASTKEPEPPVPITEADPRPQPAPVDGGEPSASGQRLYGPGTTLVSPEKAKQVVDAFRTTVAKDKPRYLIYVNRELVDEISGLRVTGRKERTESVQGETKSSFELDPNAPKPAAPPAGNAETQVNVNIGNTTNGDTHTPGKGSAEGRGTRVTAENTYTYSPKTTGTLVDKQTVRDIERLFGRPLRAGGAKLADQRTAAALISDKPLDHFTTATNEAARKDREALTKVTDVVVEILVSSRTVKVANISGDTYQTVPDIQATAIRLSDSAIIGQASATDVLGKDKVAGRVARKFDVSDIAEATALALMEDITLTTE